MTNYEAWKLYTENVESPETYLDCAYYWMIGSALQRRCWWKDSILAGEPFCANQFIILVGPPATGKSRVIAQIDQILSSIERPIERLQTAPGVKVDENHPLMSMFPSMGDSLTVEAITNRLTKLVDVFHYVSADKDGVIKKKPYMHTSAYFCLEELRSLFRRNSEDITKFLCSAYDSRSFKRITLKHGVELVQKMSVSLLAGTTTKDMAAIMKSGFMESGLASRVIFIYEGHPRKLVYDSGIEARHIPYLSQVREHIKKLGDIYGSVTTTPEADEFLRQWYENPLYESNIRVNKSGLLDHYYGRRKSHVIKMTIAVHFSESYDLVVTLEDCMRALSLLENVERRMHLALMSGGRNDLFDISQEICGYIHRYGPKTYVDLLNHFNRDVNGAELMDVLDTMGKAAKLVTVTRGNKKVFELGPRAPISDL